MLGVLIEKQKTTPDSYPLTLAGLVAGCNQKSNRDPVTDYDGDDIEETLEELRRKGAVLRYEGSGRVEKWKHAAYDWFDLKNRPAEMAVLTELLLRGPQTEGELRGRAGRMDPIPDLGTLGVILEFLQARGLVVYLTPPEQKRGVVVTHGLYSTGELERVRRQAARNAGQNPTQADAAPAARSNASQAGEIEALRGEMEALRARLDALAAEFAALKTSLGA